MEKKILKGIVEILSSFAKSYVPIPPRAYAQDVIDELNYFFKKQRIPYYIKENKNIICTYKVFKNHIINHSTQLIP